MRGININLDMSVNDNTINWLLEENNPSVRYFVLRDILKKPEKSKIVLDAKKKIMTDSPVYDILKLQNEDGFWGKPESFYTGKYRNTVWQIIILASLGADKNNKQIQKACDFVLQYSQDMESGGFAIKSSKKTGGGLPNEVIPCLTGNMLWSLIRFGYLQDPRIQQGIEWICRYQRFDDGIENPPTGWPYDKWEICWGKHTCHMGVVKSLKAFAEIPGNGRTKEIDDYIEKAAEFLLIHHIFKRSHNLQKVSKPGWKKFGFPLMYQTDILEVADILVSLGYKDKRMREAIEFIQSKQNDQGKWIMENSFNDRTLIPIEEINKPSKWLTYLALKTLLGYSA